LSKLLLGNLWVGHGDVSVLFLGWYEEVSGRNGPLADRDAVYFIVLFVVA
jgi:hypothetical protein